MNLYRHIRHLAAGFRCKEFCHGRFLGEPFSGIAKRGGPVGHETGCFHKGTHIRNHHLDGLVFCQWDLKLAALPGIQNPLFQRRLGNAQSLSCDPHPPRIQGCKTDFKPHAFPAQEIIERQAAIIEPYGTDGVCPHTAQILKIPHHKPFGSPLRHHHADLFAITGRVGLKEQQAYVRNPAVGYEYLVGVDHISVSIGNGRSLNTRRI